MRQAAFLIFDRRLSVAVFTHVLRGGKGEKAVIEEFVSSALQFFYYQLTLSRSDFEKCRTHLAKPL